MASRITPSSSYPTDAVSPGRLLRAVTPGAADLPAGACKALLILSAGDVTFIGERNADDEVFTLTGASAGAIIPLRIRRVTVATATVAAIYD